MIKTLQSLVLLWLLCGQVIAVPVFEETFAEPPGLTAWDEIAGVSNDNIQNFYSRDGSALLIDNDALDPDEPFDLGILWANAIATDIGQTYEVSFWLSRQGVAAPNAISVTLGGIFDVSSYTNTGGTTFSIVNDTRNDGTQFARYSFTHIATTATTELLFTFYENGINSPLDNSSAFYLDEISVEALDATPVPEIDASSATIPLTLCAMLLLIVGDHRRRAQSLG